MCGTCNPRHSRPGRHDDQRPSQRFIDRCKSYVPQGLSSDEAWRRLPAVVKGGGQPLPSWARILADKLPRTTAALLQLDHAQSVDSPVPTAVRAGMRRISAHLNGCAQAEAVAAFDAQQAGVDTVRWDGLLRDGYPGWSAAERAALHFARGLAL